MARRSGGGPSNTDIDMTPMIDVTFQLITFFIFTLNFSTAVQDDRVQLPLSQLAKPAEGASEDPITLQLWPDPKEQSRTMVIYNGESIPVAGIAPFLDQEARVLREAGRDPGSATVIIRGDTRVPTGEVQDLIKVCQEKAFTRFVLRAQYDESGK
ncbi:MAG: ExbD/TolR family protein [Planctomycetia bacterium]|jgi:biopolymer transport protein ExbD